MHVPVLGGVRRISLQNQGVSVGKGMHMGKTMDGMGAGGLTL
jgi:hypothetical protein